MADIARREPEIFSAGDTLVFQRSLPDYLPADGWAIRYTLTPSGGTDKAAEFVTTANPNEPTSHLARVDNFAATLAEGDYVFVGRLENSTTGEKHQIYAESLKLQANLVGGTASQPQQTEAEEMIALLRDTLKELYKLQFSETEVQRNRFKLQDQSKVLADLKYWKEVRFNEIAMQRVRAGKPSGMISVPVFSIG